MATFSEYIERNQLVDEYRVTFGGPVLTEREEQAVEELEKVRDLYLDMAQEVADAIRKIKGNR